MLKDQETAKQMPSMCAATFDLEKVLNMPKSESSSMYYKRKVSLYNFTVYNLATKEESCNVWNETIGKRGANDISSFLWRYINQETEKRKTSFHFYSDNCGGQNRNQILYTMYLKVARDLKITITHRYTIAPLTI